MYVYVVLGLNFEVLLYVVVEVFKFFNEFFFFLCNFVIINFNDG